MEEIPTWLVQPSEIDAITVVEVGDGGICKVKYDGKTYWLKRDDADVIFDDGKPDEAQMPLADVSDLDELIAAHNAPITHPNMLANATSTSEPTKSLAARSINDMQTESYENRWPRTAKLAKESTFTPAHSGDRKVDGQTVTSVVKSRLSQSTPTPLARWAGCCASGLLASSENRPLVKKWGRTQVWFYRFRSTSFRPSRPLTCKAIRRPG